MPVSALIALTTSDASHTDLRPLSAPSDNEVCVRKQCITTGLTLSERSGVGRRRQEPLPAPATHAFDHAVNFNRVNGLCKLARPLHYVHPWCGIARVTQRQTR